MDKVTDKEILDCLSLENKEDENHAKNGKSVFTIANRDKKDSLNLVAKGVICITTGKTDVKCKDQYYLWINADLLPAPENHQILYELSHNIVGIQEWHPLHTESKFKSVSFVYKLPSEIYSISVSPDKDCALIEILPKSSEDSRLLYLNFERCVSHPIATSEFSNILSITWVKRTPYVLAAKQMSTYLYNREIRLFNPLPGYEDMDALSFKTMMSTSIEVSPDGTMLAASDSAGVRIVTKNITFYLKDILLSHKRNSIRWDNDSRYLTVVRNGVSSKHYIPYKVRKQILLNYIEKTLSGILNVRNPLIDRLKRAFVRVCMRKTVAVMAVLLNLVLSVCIMKNPMLCQYVYVIFMKYLTYVCNMLMKISKMMPAASTLTKRLYYLSHAVTSLAHRPRNVIIYITRFILKMCYLISVFPIVGLYTMMYYYIWAVVHYFLIIFKCVIVVKYVNEISAQCVRVWHLLLAKRLPSVQDVDAMEERIKKAIEADKNVGWYDDFKEFAKADKYPNIDELRHWIRVNNSECINNLQCSVQELLLIGTYTLMCFVFDVVSFVVFAYNYHTNSKYRVVTACIQLLSNTANVVSVYAFGINEEYISIEAAAMCDTQLQHRANVWNTRRTEAVAMKQYSVLENAKMLEYSELQAMKTKSNITMNILENIQNIVDLAKNDVKNKPKGMPISKQKNEKFHEYMVDIANLIKRMSGSQGDPNLQKKWNQIVTELTSVQESNHTPDKDFLLASPYCTAMYIVYEAYVMWDYYEAIITKHFYIVLYALNSKERALSVILLVNIFVSAHWALCLITTPKVRLIVTDSFNGAALMCFAGYSLVCTLANGFNYTTCLTILCTACFALFVTVFYIVVWGLFPINRIISNTNIYSADVYTCRLVQNLYCVTILVYMVNFKCTQYCEGDLVFTTAVHAVTMVATGAVLTFTTIAKRGVHDAYLAAGRHVYAIMAFIGNISNTIKDKLLIFVSTTFRPITNVALTMVSYYKPHRD